MRVGRDDTDVSPPYQLRGLELAAGWVPGYVGLDVPGWPRRPAATVRAALHAVLRPCLSAPPCAVAFSGGRDSSVILAVAVDLARREGLPLPVAVTRHHPGFPSLDEERWQRRVIDHLRVTEWVRLPFGDELDVVGPVAQRVLARHGVVWPAAAHTSIPVFEVARGGTVLTGEGGDELFEPPRLQRLLFGLKAARSGRRTGAAMRVALRAVAPRRIRRREATGRAWDVAPAWLPLAARQHLVDLLVDDALAAPATLRGVLRRLPARRAWREGVRTLECLAGELNVRVRHPLLDPETVTALHAAAPPWGYADRATGLRALFADLLPPDVINRRGKVVFNEALFTTGHARALAEAWKGDGFDPAMVDARRLREEWLRPTPSVLSAPLLQQLWCRDRR